MQIESGPLLGWRGGFTQKGMWKLSGVYNFILLYILTVVYNTLVHGLSFDGK